MPPLCILSGEPGKLGVLMRLYAAEAPILAGSFRLPANQQIKQLRTEPAPAKARQDAR